MRWKVPPIERARGRASVVFPTPGTSSISRWPRAQRAITAWRITPAFPRSTRAMLASSAATSSAGARDPPRLPPSPPAPPRCPPSRGRAVVVMTRRQLYHPIRYLPAGAVFKNTYNRAGQFLYFSPKNTDSETSWGTSALVYLRSHSRFRCSRLSASPLGAVTIRQGTREPAAPVATAPAASAEERAERLTAVSAAGPVARRTAASAVSAAARAVSAGQLA